MNWGENLNRKLSYQVATQEIHNGQTELPQICMVLKNVFFVDGAFLCKIHQKETRWPCSLEFLKRGRKKPNYKFQIRPHRRDLYSFCICDL